MRKGKFITFEGSEGVGKSTNIEFVRARLEQEGIECILTREPGGTKLGEKLRETLLSPETGDISTESELLMMFAARAEHIQKIIVPALEEGKWVLCDRFTDASYAYQGGGRGMSFERIQEIEQWVQNDFRPDLTLLLDMSVEQAMQRAQERSQADRFEQQPLDFFEAVRKAYLDRAEQYAERYVVIDASASLDAVKASVNKALDTFLANS